jgi:hypothetical protein
MKDLGADLDALCTALERILEGPTRHEIVATLGRSGRMDDALRRIRAAMSSHGFEGLPRDFERTVRRLDNRTRQDGFRVLHAWNHTSHQFTDDVVPVLMIDFFERAGVEDPEVSTTLAILLDYYFLHLLALAAMRAWDTEEPGATLDRVTHLLHLLQGPDGSGHHFVADAETLMIYALSQFHPEEHAYDRVIERTALLPEAHEVAFARVSAAVLGAHLRWGFWLMYGRDVVKMRNDNVGDYPWLLYSVLVLLRAWSGILDDDARVDERKQVAGSLLLGLAADPWAFAGRPPPALEPYPDEYAEVRTLLEAHGPRLLEELEAHAPGKEAYAPLSLHFNFPHNALVAIVTLALLEGRPQALTLNDLFEEDEFGAPGDEGEVTSVAPETKEGLARTLMAFSRGSPDRLGYRGAMLVAYDPLSAMRTFSMTIDTIRKSLPEA